MANPLSDALSITRACGGPWRGLMGWLDSAPWLRPAPPEDRCIMGSPVDPGVHCRRRIDNDGLWCKRHEPPENRDVI